MADAAPAGPPPARPAKAVRGSRLVLPLLLALLLAAVVVGIYKSREQAGPPLRFERLAAGDPQAANATALPARAVHDAYFLEDHLRTALERGNSTETLALRTDTMRDTLRSLTGHDAPWLVSWNGAAFRVRVG